jgi:hypothetical protein
MPGLTPASGRSAFVPGSLTADAAYRVHPERFVHQAPKPAAAPTEVWINKPLNSNEITH